MEHAEHLDDYYKEYGNDFVLLKIIPALPRSHDDSQPYWSCPSNNDDNTRFAPVFMSGPHQQQNSRYPFLFTSEEYLLRKEEISNDVRQYIDDHPWICYFQGCDDGSVGMRFKTQESLLEFVECLEVFEELFQVAVNCSDEEIKNIVYLKRTLQESVAVMFENTIQYHN
jgi:hypothetical protein